MSGIVNICDRNTIGGFLVTIDTEKVFDSLDHKFILAVSKKIGFGKNFVSWIEPLLNNQESCVINGCITTRYSLYNEVHPRGTLSQPMYSFYV